MKEILRVVLCVLQVALLSPVPSERSNSLQQPKYSIGVGELSLNRVGLSADRQTCIVPLSDAVGLDFVMVRQKFLLCFGKSRLNIK